MVPSVRGQTIMTDGGWRHEAAGHMTSEVRKQRGVNAGSFIQSPSLPYGPVCSKGGFSLFSLSFLETPSQTCLEAGGSRSG